MILQRYGTSHVPNRPTLLSTLPFIRNYYPDYLILHAARKKLYNVLFAALFVMLTHLAFSQQSSINVTFPSDITVCGPAQTTVITLTALDTLSSITATFDLLALTGFEIDEPSFGSMDGVNFMAPGTLMFPDLFPGQSASFTIDFLARCGSTVLGGANFIKIDFDYMVDGVTSQQNTGMSPDPGFSVTQPGLDFILASTDEFRPVINETDTIIKQIANAGDGDIDSALYFVRDHPNLSLCQIIIEGVDAMFMPNGNTYVLDFAGTNGDTLFYWIGQGAILQTGNGDAVWNGLSGGQESFVVYEIWKGTDCVSPPDIVRGIGYGCEPASELTLCTSEPNNSIVVFDKVPDLTAGPYHWGTSRPACYADDRTQVGYYITNQGEAPADTVIVNLSTSNAGDILTYRYALMGKSGPYSDGLATANMIAGCAGIMTVFDTIYDANLDPGDTLWIQVEMLFDCMCNPACGISGIYRSDLAVEAIDRCGNGLPGQGSSWGDYAVSVSGFVEGPLDIKDGESGCLTYTITGYRNNWFNGAYPASYYEMDFNFPAGLEIDNASINWEDANGTIFIPSEISFLDGGPTMGDTIKVRWEQMMIPASWSPGSGTQIQICFDAECAVSCGGEFPVEVTAKMDFVIDPSCMSCTQEEVFCPPALPMVLQCYTPGTCMCDGLAVLDLDINRVNFGMGDNDNDRCPTALETIDMNLVEAKRYLQGDTLKAAVSALISGAPSDPMNPWINSTFQLVTQTHTITPIGGEIRIYDASVMSYYSCDVLSMSTSTSLTGDTIDIDLSTATLRSFCPSEVPMSYVFENGDSLELCLTYTVKEDFSGQQKPVLYQTIWTVDDGVNPAQSCSQESDRLTQIGISESYSVDLNNPFGGCEKTTSVVTESRYFGSSGFDEFPFEVRKLGIPEEFIYVKPTDFSFSMDMFGFTLRGVLTGNQVTHQMGDPSMAGFILISGDSLVFKSGDYLRNLNSMKLPPDEGYVASFFPRIQGDCRSIAGAYDNSASLSSSVTEITYCTPLIQRPTVQQQINYKGGPQLLVIPDAMNIEVNQPNQYLSFTLTNSDTISAANSFLYITSPTGNVVVNSLIETTGGMMTPVLGSALGIYPLGLTPASPDRTFDIYVTVNSCGTETLDFVAGWDCNQYPVTVLEAICQDPSTVTFSTGTAGLGLLVTIPTADTILNLCDEIEYEAILNSTMAGSLRDVILSFDLPIGHEYIPGSFRYMWPQLPSSGFIPTAD
ncbi:MAG: hypothetical protein HKN76_02215, partial [Saprospiraceae bacterium]|nr:hypothetical protein [Saprospiraceae bacterium]